jgi:hypothetical protein
MDFDRTTDDVMTHGVELYDEDDILLERWTFPTADDARTFCSGISMGLRIAENPAKTVLRHLDPTVPFKSKVIA